MSSTKDITEIKLCYTVSMIQPDEEIIPTSSSDNPVSYNKSVVVQSSIYCSGLTRAPVDLHQNVISVKQQEQRSTNIDLWKQMLAPVTRIYQGADDTFIIVAEKADKIYSSLEG